MSWKTGAIAVNSRMETQIPGIFAAGENVAGGNAHFPGVFGTAIFKTFKLTVAITGLSEQSAQEAGFKPVCIVMTGTDRARYYPGLQEFSLKLIADRPDGRLLGAQVIGCGNVDKMIDIVATALLGKLTCADMENADLAYSPPFSPVLSTTLHKGKKTLFGEWVIGRDIDAQNQQGDNYGEYPIDQCFAAIDAE